MKSDDGFQQSCLVLAHAEAAESADALEDADPAHLWMWELRDLRALPKTVRTEATARKKRLKQVYMSMCMCMCMCMRMPIAQKFWVYHENPE